MSRRSRRMAKVRPPDPDALDAPWRVFLAVPLVEPVRAAVAGLIGELAPERWPLRWVAAEGAHLTLHFLGEQPRERVELLRLGLPATVAAHAGFDLRTGNLGIFPNIRQPRVLWLGLYGPTHRLETLHAALGATLKELGSAAEEERERERDRDRERFHPHVTLGRLRDAAPGEVPLRHLSAAIRQRLADPATGVLAGPAPLPVPVREVELVRSRLGPGAARYETVARFPLAAPTAAPPAPTSDVSPPPADAPPDARR